MSTASPDGARVRTAVVTGAHRFDVPAFHDLLRSLPSVEFYLQDLDNLVGDTQGVFDDYQVLLFYNMHRECPSERAQVLLQRPAETGQGIVVLHHGLLAFPDWAAWSALCGIEDRSFEYDHGQAIDIEVADPAHPITAHLSPWQMLDETYLVQDPGPDAHVLLTTDHPRSMRTLAWTRQVGRARVACCALGHDREAYVDAGFRRIVGRSILWAARAI